MVKQQGTIIDRNQREGIAHAGEEEVHSSHYMAHHSFIVWFDVDDAFFTRPEYGENVGLVVRTVVFLTKVFVVDVLVSERENGLLFLATLELKKECTLRWCGNKEKWGKTYANAYGVDFWIINTGKNTRIAIFLDSSHLNFSAILYNVGCLSILLEQWSLNHDFLLGRDHFRSTIDISIQ